MEMDTPSFRGGEERGVSDTDGCGNKAKKGCNIAEILGVLAHELGHWSLSHNLKNLVIGEVSEVKVQQEGLYVSNHTYLSSFSR